MPAFDLDMFAEDGIIREKTVREAFAAHDWEQYRDKTVHVRGCGKAAFPSWAYLMAVAHLAHVAKRITFGEERSPMMIFVLEDFKNQSKSESAAKSSATK
jgi:hypothetical protein